MLNSPTLCQDFVQKPLKITHKQFPQSIIYQYMDDILLADSKVGMLEKMFEAVKEILHCWGITDCP